MEAENWSGMFATYDQKEGMHAFLEKRKPSFARPLNGRPSVYRKRITEMMNDIVITAGCRTPIGTIGGQFKTLTALDLSIPIMKEPGAPFRH